MTFDTQKFYSGVNIQGFDAGSQSNASNFFRTQSRSADKALKQEGDQSWGCIGPNDVKMIFPKNIMQTE